MLLKIISILSVQYFIVECLIPGLKVNKMDKNFIKKQRQDTLDMCRKFSEAPSQLINPSNRRSSPKVRIPYHEKDKMQRSRRGKRSAEYQSPGAELEDARRVEHIVDKLYDDMEENGEKVDYRKRNLDPTTTTTTAEAPQNKSARRFHFAPKLLLGPEPDDGPHEPDTNEKPVDVPWHKKWIHGIVPFFIDPNTYDSQLADKITKAFDYFERLTCIRLQRLKDRPTDKKSLKEVEWLYITNPLGIKQCVHSNALKVNKGVQLVVFGYDCLSLGEVVHEVMHVLGFSHEHTRPDRDQHITVLWNNIKPGYKNYFEIKEVGSLTILPYDYESILHYPPRAFSRNGQHTILADNTGAKLGQRKGLSKYDIDKVTAIYGNECVARNRKYLLHTCPSVVKPPEKTKEATKTDIEDYFKDRLWPYGVVTYKIRDDVEFSAEERENLKAVFRHIEKETCIEFNDASEESEETEEETADDDEKTEDSATGTQVDTLSGTVSETSDTATNTEGSGKSEADNEITESNDKTETSQERRSFNKTSARKVNLNLRKAGQIKKVKKSARRHADNILILTRSPEPGCKCPSPGKPDGNQNIKINADCFNSVNDLLHLFVHILGLDHQHNMHDRDQYLKIVWENLTPDVKEEMKDKLPPAASVGFPYDYLSVMHYPWLQIKDGVANFMYPVWNDGWAMGHWQGLSSIDVQKLNLLYFQQCLLRKKIN